MICMHKSAIIELGSTELFKQKREVLVMSELLITFPIRLLI